MHIHAGILAVLVAVALPSLNARADTCVNQSRLALDELTAAGIIAADRTTRSRAEQILQRLCDGGSTDVAPAPVQPAEASQSKRFLGIDFEKAPADSPGNDRLRKRR